MTVGIAITNCKESVVVADRRGTQGENRKTDSVDKLICVDAEQYHGILIGSGNALQIGALKRFNYDNFPDLDECLHKAWEEFVNETNEDRKKRLWSRKKVLEAEAEVMHDNDTAGQYVMQKINEYKEELRKELENETGFIASFHHNGRIRQFYFRLETIKELAGQTAITGSGTDGAHMYLMRCFDESNANKLTRGELLVYAMNAYLFSEVSPYVGGTPDVAVVSAKKVEIVSEKKARKVYDYYNRQLDCLRPEKIVMPKIKGLLD